LEGVVEQLSFDIIGKVCTKCGKWKLLDEFHKNKQGRYGRRSYCKDCVQVYHQGYYFESRETVLAKGRGRYHANIEQERIRSRLYRAKHPNADRERYLKNREKILEQKRIYRAENRDKIRAINRQQYLKNREQRTAYAREYHTENREECLKRNRRYYAKHQDRLKTYARKYRAEHKKQVAAAKSQYQKENPDQIRAARARRETKKTQVGGSFTAQEWQALCEKYGNCCLCCGTIDEPLTVDHVIPISKGGSSNISNLQPLCGPCNSRKHDQIIDYRD